MADVERRAEKEAALERLLSRRLRGRLRALRDQLGTPPDVTRVGDAWWDELEHELRQELAGFLIVIYLLQSEELVRSYGVDVPIATQRSDGAAHIAETSARAAADFVRGTRDALQAADTEDDLDQTAESAFSDATARRLAVTEITRAASRAELAAARRLRTDYAVSTAQVWITERDARVCPICRPLDRTPLEHWENRFPYGPPAHPNCRCYLSVRRV